MQLEVVGAVELQLRSEEFEAANLLLEGHLVREKEFARDPEHGAKILSCVVEIGERHEGFEPCRVDFQGGIVRAPC